MNLPKSITFIVATSLVIVAVFFSIISISTNSWAAYSVGGYRYEEGLWKSCAKINGQSTACVSFDEKAVRKSAKYINAVRSLSIISILLTIATIGIATVSFIKEHIILAIGPILTVILQALMMLIALSVYAGKFDDDVLKLSWSFGLGWVGVVFYIFGAIAYGVRAALILKSNRDYKQIIPIK